MPVSRLRQDTRFILEEKCFDPERCRRCRQPRKISFQMPADPLCVCVCVCASACPSVLSGDELGGWRSLWSTLLEAVDSIGAILTG